MQRLLEPALFQQEQECAIQYARPRSSELNYHCHSDLLPMQVRVRALIPNLSRPQEQRALVCFGSCAELKSLAGWHAQAFAMLTQWHISWYTVVSSGILAHYSNHKLDPRCQDAQGCRRGCSQLVRGGCSRAHASCNLCLPLANEPAAAGFLRWYSPA